ncbi:YihY/virulence factor BrkB family protein [Defluviimonas sp. WL0002]|uniref:YihY/virulence factor BrkB family protein n=1 Tax=Albidovulum marisflavi TaxID=2984159 RepID=A0ABT2Z818_9RHOB|nr:YihY/virulence factor BrkB family protein [Defluviimonas sp. WL0002]MCV2867285.1 YihY/virulence factor BrkB family protein [Defluviimonas sp. WL0002]
MRSGNASDKSEGFGIAELLHAIWVATGDRNLALISAGVAFYTMLAIFPGMVALIAFWSIFADPLVIDYYLQSIHDLIPVAAYQVIEGQLKALLATGSGTSGWTTTLSMLIALYSVHSGVDALVAGLHAAHEQKRRTLLLRLVGTIALTGGIFVLLFAALATVVAVPIALNFVTVGPLEGAILTVLPWAVLMLVVLSALLIFYRFGLSATRVRRTYVLPGAVLAALTWAAGSVGFSAYLTYFANYNRIYGSIGAVVALLVWLYMSAYIVLFGAVVNAELTRSRRS